MRVAIRCVASRCIERRTSPLPDSAIHRASMSNLRSNPIGALPDTGRLLSRVGAEPRWLFRRSRGGQTCLGFGVQDEAMGDVPELSASRRYDSRWLLWIRIVALLVGNLVSFGAFSTGREWWLNDWLCRYD